MGGSAEYRASKRVKELLNDAKPYGSDVWVYKDRDNEWDGGELAYDPDMMTSNDPDSRDNGGYYIDNSNSNLYDVYKEIKMDFYTVNGHEYVKFTLNGKEYALQDDSGDLEKVDEFLQKQFNLESTGENTIENAVGVDDDWSVSSEEAYEQRMNELTDYYWSRRNE